MHYDPAKALAAQVRGVNRVNAIAAQVHAQLVYALGPLVGKPVLKVDRDLREDVRRRLPQFAADGVRVTRASSSCNLEWNVTVTEPLGDGGTVSYFSAGVVAGLLDGQVLQGLASWTPQRTDWTAEEVAGLRRAAEAAYDALRAAEAALGPFRR